MRWNGLVMVLVVTGFALLVAAAVYLTSWALGLDLTFGRNAFTCAAVAMFAGSVLSQVLPEDGE